MAEEEDIEQDAMEMEDRSPNSNVGSIPTNEEADAMGKLIDALFHDHVGPVVDDYGLHHPFDADMDPSS